MRAKLTLSIDTFTIQRAKQYAGKRKKSLSQIIENYLKILSVNDTASLDNIPPVTRSLGGILKGKKEIDYKSSIADYLETKYK